jgi:hypothetical protein
VSAERRGAADYILIVLSPADYIRVADARAARAQVAEILASADRRASAVVDAARAEARRFWEQSKGAFDAQEAQLERCARPSSSSADTSRLRAQTLRAGAGRDLLGVGSRAARRGAGAGAALSRAAERGAAAQAGAGAAGAAACRGAPRRPARRTRTARAPPPRTKWTRRVPHPVLIGHAASLAPRAAALRHGVVCGGVR